MEMDLFKWSIVTAVVASVSFFILGNFTTNDFYWWVLVSIISLISIITFSVMSPKVSSFKPGGILGVVVIISMAVVGDIRGGLEELGIIYLTLIIAFVVGGLISFVIKKAR